MALTAATSPVLFLVETSRPETRLSPRATRNIRRGQYNCHRRPRCLRVQSVEILLSLLDASLGRNRDANGVATPRRIRGARRQRVVELDRARILAFQLLRELKMSRVSVSALSIGIPRTVPSHPWYSRSLEIDPQETDYHFVRDS